MKGIYKKASYRASILGIYFLKIFADCVYEFFEHQNEGSSALKDAHDSLIISLN